MSVLDLSSIGLGTAFAFEAPAAAPAAARLSIRFFPRIWRMAYLRFKSGPVRTRRRRFRKCRALKEYGFTDFESGTYTRDDGRKVALKAIRFTDASGAYGAFTYYKMPQMLKESIPDQAASLNERVLFYRGNILVDAVFEKLTAMSAAELRELAEALPLPVGNTRNLPSPAAVSSENQLRKEHRQIRHGAGWPGENQCAAFRRNWWISVPVRKWPWATIKLRTGWPR